MNKHAVAFIIIAYHPEPQGFARLLKRLPPKDVIIIDNGQTLAAKDAGRATVLSQTKNVGYATAANVGLRHAIAHGYEWYVILNQDVLMTRTGGEDLIHAIVSQEPCIAGPFLGRLDPKRWTTILTSTPGVDERSLKKVSKMPVSTPGVEYVSGSCMAIHRNVVEKIGYMYEPYFLYYEEADYCVRAARAGFPIRRIDVPGLSHEESVSLGRGSVAHQYYLARNHLLFVSRLAPFAVQSYECIRFPKTLSEHMIRKEWGALLGIRDLLFRRFGPYGGQS